jgi:hypothetical protein
MVEKRAFATNNPFVGIRLPQTGCGFMGDLTDKELKNLKPRAKLYKVTDRDSPVRDRTVFRRMIRSGSRMAAPPPADCFDGC